MRKSFLALAVIGIIWFGVTGCATESYVNEQIAQTVDLIKITGLEDAIKETQDQVEANQTEIARLKEAAAEQNEQLHKLSNVSQEEFTFGEEALSRAVEAGKVTKGKLLYEVTFTDDAVHFGFDRSDLSEEAKAAIDSFAGSLKAENKDVYIEIQGHTDNIGREGYNLMLGQARAKAVNSYLHTQHGIPLHRMNTFSYGESKPVVDNNNRSNRAINRRITLVVIE
jgi:outer membrane protein OmpA-like peptidoglycan-associated protein